MAERAAYLVDEVLPQVPVRQWVLTLPYRLRYRLAWDHALCRAVLGVYARGLLAFYARTARAHGIPEGQTGTVTVIQRFRSGLQLNVHLHTLVLDGVFSETRPGRLTFHPAPLPSDADVAHVLATVRARVGRLLARRQLEPADDTAPAGPARRSLARPRRPRQRLRPGPRRPRPSRRRPRPPPRRRAGPRSRHLPRPAPGPARRLRPPRQRLGPSQPSRPARATLPLSPPPPARPGPRPPPRRRARPRRAQDRSGAMARRTSSSSPSNSWRSSRRSSPDPPSTCSCITASSPRTRAGARRSSATAARPRTSMLGARGQPPRRRHPGRVDLGRPDAPRVRPRCPGLPPLWRPAARHRHRAGPPRGAGHPRPPGALRRPAPPGPAPAALL